MITKIMALEFQKHKKTFFSILAIAALGIATATGIVSNWGGLSLRDALVGSGVFAICTLPLVAAIFGVQSAASLRREAEKSHEEVLPLNPRLRVAGAYLSSLAYFSAIAILVLGLLGYAEIYEVVYAWIGVPLFYPGLGFLLLVQTHFLAFAFSYWLRLPLLAGGIALILQAINTFVNGVLIAVNSSFYFGDPATVSSDMNFWLLALNLFAWFAGIFVLLRAAKRLERGQPLRFFRAIGLAVCLLSGPTLSCLVLARVVSQVNAELELYGYSFWTLYWDYVAKNLPGYF